VYPIQQYVISLSVTCGRSSTIMAALVRLLIYMAESYTTRKNKNNQSRIHVIKLKII